MAPSAGRKIGPPLSPPMPSSLPSGMRYTLILSVTSSSPGNKLGMRIFGFCVGGNRLLSRWTASRVSICIATTPVGNKNKVFISHFTDFVCWYENHWEPVMREGVKLKRGISKVGILPTISGSDYGADGSVNINESIGIRLGCSPNNTFVVKSIAVHKTEINHKSSFQGLGSMKWYEMRMTLTRNNFQNIGPHQLKYFFLIAMTLTRNNFKKSAETFFNYLTYHDLGLMTS